MGNKKLKKFKNCTHRRIVFVSMSTQVASVGGSYLSKYLESIPKMTGNGAFNVMARNNGQRGT